MTLPSLPLQHAIITHFPVAMLITGIAFDLASSVARKPVWRAVGFWMLLVGALAAVPSVVIGWMTYATLFSEIAAPLIAHQHRFMAIVTTILAVILVIVRIAGRDEAKGRARGLHLLVGVLTAMAVGVTGHLGGTLVFSGAASPSVATAPASENAVTVPPPKIPALTAEGERLFWSDETGCKGCHRIGETGNTIGPDLTSVGVRRPDIAWHLRHLQDPASVTPGSMMPKYDKLTPLQREALATYLVSRR